MYLTILSNYKVCAAIFICIAIIGPGAIAVLFFLSLWWISLKINKDAALSPIAQLANTRDCSEGEIIRDLYTKVHPGFPIGEKKINYLWGQSELTGKNIFLPRKPQWNSAKTPGKK